MTETFNTPPSLPNLESDSPWSYKGRFGRLSYLAWTLVLGLIAIGVIFVITLVGGLLGLFSHSMGSLFAIILLPLIPFLYFMIVFQIRRLHDLNRTGWWTVLPFANSIITQILNAIFHNISVSIALTGLGFIINFGFTLYLMIAKGTEEVNNYGYQRPTPQWEKVLGWINIGCMILGIVALLSFGIPAYHHYQQKAMAMQQSSSINDQSEPMTTPSSTP